MKQREDEQPKSYKDDQGEHGLAKRGPRTETAHEHLDDVHSGSPSGNKRTSGFSR